MHSDIGIVLHRTLEVDEVTKDPFQFINETLVKHTNSEINRLLKTSEFDPIYPAQSSFR